MRCQRRPSTHEAVITPARGSSWHLADAAGNACQECLARRACLNMSLKVRWPLTSAESPQGDSFMLCGELRAACCAAMNLRQAQHTVSHQRVWTPGWQLIACQL